VMVGGERGHHAVRDAAERRAVENMVEHEGPAARSWVVEGTAEPE